MSNVSDLINNFSVPAPFSVPSCICPMSKPCVAWGFTQKMAVLGLGSSLLGVCATVGFIYFFKNLNQIYPRMRKISFHLNSILKNRFELFCI